MVQTVAAGFDIDAQEQALHRIETAFASAQLRAAAADQPAAAQARLIESGPPVFAVRTRARMKADVARLSLIAAALVAVILLFAYRSRAHPGAGARCRWRAECSPGSPLSAWRSASCTASPWASA